MREVNTRVLGKLVLTNRGRFEINKLLFVCDTALVADPAETFLFKVDRAWPSRPAPVRKIKQLSVHAIGLVCCSWYVVSCVSVQDCAL